MESTFKSIIDIKKYWIDEMKTNTEIKKVFVKSDEFNVDLYFSREGDKIKCKLVSN